MNEVVREWITKAEGDYTTASREMTSTQNPNFDAVCFHAQQCVEKYLKGLLIARSVTPPKTHDLAILYRLMIPVFPDWNWSIDELRLLTRAAVVFRYPGESADQEDAAVVLEICTRMRTSLQRLSQNER